jgi:hypothetical protein
MSGGGLLAVGGAVRALVARLLPPWRAVRRWSRRLLVVGLLCAGVGLRSVAAVVRVGPATTGPVRSGAAAVGLACLVLALAGPAVYWFVAVCTATGSLVGRRAVALGRAVIAVGRRRLAPSRRPR